METTPQKVNLAEKLAAIREYWDPHIVGELNGQHVRLAKVQGEFIWHSHADEDEFFLVLDGELLIHFRDRTVTLMPGEFLIVPRGVEHRPEAADEAHLLLFEPASTVNTGSVTDERTRTTLKRLE